MFDINFYMKTYPIRQRLEAGEKIPQEELFNIFEKFRSRDPVIYNIETTNACNMTCKMCPRTTQMTREITFLENEYIITTC